MREARVRGTRVSGGEAGMSLRSQTVQEGDRCVERRLPTARRPNGAERGTLAWRGLRLWCLLEPGQERVARRLHQRGLRISELSDRNREGHKKPERKGTRSPRQGRQTSPGHPGVASAQGHQPSPGSDSAGQAGQQGRETPSVCSLAISSSQNRAVLGSGTPGTLKGLDQIPHFWASLGRLEILSGFPSVV